MHFMSQLRYNPTSRRDEFYYRIKESFRDLTGRVRSRIMLNVGFINEDHQPEDIRDIGKCLTYLHEHQGESNLFDSPLSHYNEFVQRKANEFWSEMVNNGSIDAVKTTIEESRQKAERLVDVNTESCHDRRNKHNRREGVHEIMQRTDQGGRRYLWQTKVQENAIQKNHNHKSL